MYLIPPTSLAERLMLMSCLSEMYGVQIEKILKFYSMKFRLFCDNKDKKMEQNNAIYEKRSAVATLHMITRIGSKQLTLYNVKS